MYINKKTCKMNGDKKLSNLPYANVQRMSSSRTATATTISPTKSSETTSKASTLRYINQEELRSLFEQQKGSQYFIPDGYEPILIPRDSQLQPVATLLQNNLQNNKGLQQRSLQKQQLKIQQANQNSAVPGVVVVNKTLTQLVSPINCNINSTPPDVRFPHLVLARATAPTPRGGANENLNIPNHLTTNEDSNNELLFQHQLSQTIDQNKEPNQIQYSVNSCSPSSPNEYVRIESTNSFNLMMDGVSPDSESDAASFGFFDYGYQSHLGESFDYLQPFNVNQFDFGAMIPSTSNIDS
ncbi:23131_t:CDS:2 [Cetraspora pellucida]|uniref:23131_t:CDS:1 n=1 Tax=Cetraspora pellucida TaxID=1433469 RepID=A0A9N8ZNZ4_9GLOM|nr:23131_t:CDS:2 [Cetraspora pellucida]